MIGYRYAKQPSEPRNPAVGSVWLNTATGLKQRRGADGWEPFVDERLWTPADDQILRDLYPAGGRTAVGKALPHRTALSVSMRALKIGVRAPDLTAGRRKTLTDAETVRAVDLYDVDGVPMDAVARQIGHARATVQNAVMIALCRRRGYSPAERDEHGYLMPAGIDRLRELLRKGLKGCEIQLRLGVSAGIVSHERRRYGADLKARGKRPLPPPGGGQRYSGAKVSRETVREIEQLLIEGFGTPKVAAKTGVSKTHVQRHRTRLIRKLRRRGEALKGCDLDGNRVRILESTSSILPSQRDALREQLLARVPVLRAGRAVGIGSVNAYRIRDQLAAEMAERGETLPPPIRLSGKAATIAAREAAWLPMDKPHLIRFRTLCREHGDGEGRRLMEAELAAEKAAAAAQARRPKTFEEQLAAVGRGEAGLVAKIPLRRPGYAGTLGGVASGAL